MGGSLCEREIRINVVSTYNIPCTASACERDRTSRETAPDTVPYRTPRGHMPLECTPPALIAIGYLRHLGEERHITEAIILRHELALTTP